MYRFDDLQGFAHALRAGDQELTVPKTEHVADNEWVLAIFEIGGGRGRATAAAARGLAHGGVQTLAFERRDWERLVEFAASSEHMPIAHAVGDGDTGSIPVFVDTAHAPHSPPDEDPTLVRSSKAPIVGPAASAASSQRAPSHRPSAPTPVPGSGRRAARTPLKTKAAKMPRPNQGRVVTMTGLPAGLRARVLVCDDDRDIREVVGAMLEAVGLDVETATSGEQALERIRLKKYDLLVLDWNLPGMTGIELCRLIRREAVIAALPVLFLTAHASSKDIVEAFASGADDYVVKPFRAPELGARIFGLLRRVRVAQSAT